MEAALSDLFLFQGISSLTAAPKAWAFQVKQARKQTDDYSAVIWMLSEDHTGTSDTGFYGGPYSMGAELDSDRKIYRRLSPISHADRIRSPTLLLQGTDDERCPADRQKNCFPRWVVAAKPARGW
jgi:prolyl oligopeptidase family protein